MSTTDLGSSEDILIKKKTEKPGSKITKRRGGETFLSTTCSGLVAVFPTLAQLLLGPNRNPRWLLFTCQITSAIMKRDPYVYTEYPTSHRIKEGINIIQRPQSFLSQASGVLECNASEFQSPARCLTEDIPRPLSYITKSSCSSKQVWNCKHLPILDKLTW